MKHPKLINYSSCAVTGERRIRTCLQLGMASVTRCDSPSWLWEHSLAHWHWVHTSPACFRSLASRESQALLADSSSATLSLSLVVPAMAQGVRPGEEELNPSPQTARKVQSPQIQMQWHSHSHTPELNTGHFQLQDILPGHCFVQAKSSRHVRKSEQRFWVQDPSIISGQWERDSVRNLKLLNLKWDILA